MRWIAASLIVINGLALAAQLTLWENPAPEPRTSRARPVVEGAASIRLLDELGAGTVQDMMSEKERRRSAARTSIDSAGALCTMVGPFSELLKAEYLAERLAALDVTARVAELEVPGEPNYWVYLPPRDTRKQAFALLRELQAKGIDSYVIPKGELENGISFGMFSKPKLADNRLEDMRSRGYEAELQEVTRTHRETWVVLAPGQGRRVDPETWSRLLADQDGLERRQNFCPPVASE
ncbi:SPOR domain-containing protein [Gilvimarinus sp. F26214L]|uniref:SPOR domain-containing protein n=1 Tax=Gilvimarinus sp. DZF01 TaxID=3461371 RepID=UPI0040466390